MVREKQQFDVWKDDVFPALQSKLDEFNLLGYDKVKLEEVWQCVLYKLRKQKEFIHLHEFVRVIMTLKVTEYMTWLTIANYKEKESLSIEELARDIS